MFSLQRGKRHQIQSISHLPSMTWGNQRMQSSCPGYWSCTCTPSNTLLSTHKIPGETWKCIFMMCIGWRTRVDKDKGFFLLAKFILYFPRQCPGDAHAVQLCTGFSILALVLHGLSCISEAEVQVKIPKSEEGHTWLCCSRMSLAAPAMEHCLLYFPGDGLSPSQTMTRYFS